MKLLDVIKRAILEGKLDTELGITDCDVMQRFDKVIELIDKPIQLPKFEPYKDLTPFDYSKSNVNPNPFDWRNKVWCNIEETTDG